MDSLEILNLAGNQLTTLKTSFHHLKSLKFLNISCNRISKFKEVHYLSKLPSVRSLYLSDPHYGPTENPICGLSNYSIYVLFHLIQLEVLDTFIISE